MNFQGENKNRQSFQAGMTLEQYLRNVQFHEQPLPTADTQKPQSQIQELEENLYKTANVGPFPQPNHKLMTFSIKEIQEESFEDSLDQLRQSTNVASTNFQKVAKQQLQPQIPMNGFKKKEKQSISPGKEKATNFSPEKTFTKTFYGYDQSQYKHKSVGKNTNIATTLYGCKFAQVHKEKMKKIESEREKKVVRRKTKQTDMGDLCINNMNAVKHFDMRIQGFKDRLHTKKR